MFKSKIYFNMQNKFFPTISLMDKSSTFLMLIMKNCINKDDFDIDAIASEINKNFFPNSYKLLQVALTIPVSSASCERSFSVMRRIKT